MADQRLVGDARGKRASGGDDRSLANSGRPPGRGRDYAVCSDKCIFPDDNLSHAAGVGN